MELPKIKLTMRELVALVIEVIDQVEGRDWGNCAIVADDAKLTAEERETIRQAAATFGGDPLSGKFAAAARAAETASVPATAADLTGSDDEHDPLGPEALERAPERSSEEEYSLRQNMQRIKTTLEDKRYDTTAELLRSIHSIAWCNAELLCAILDDADPGAILDALEHGELLVGAAPGEEPSTQTAKIPAAPEIDPKQHHWAHDAILLLLDHHEGKVNAVAKALGCDWGATNQAIKGRVIAPRIVTALEKLGYKPAIQEA